MRWNLPIAALFYTAVPAVKSNGDESHSRVPAYRIVITAGFAITRVISRERSML